MPLVLVPTPIGNLEDMTLRAIRVLKEADVIACEDTRTSGVLLRHYGISKPLISLHMHNEKGCSEHLMSYLADNKNVALISDAGTPGISDPGYLLFRNAIDAGYEADILPGPSALLPALILSGLTPHPFLFHGFPPEKPGQRKKLFESLAPLCCTLVFYLSPHKAERHVAEMTEVFGDRRAALVREISKLYQEAVRGSLSEIGERLARGVKGEMVLVVEGRSGEAADEDPSLWQDEAEVMMNEGHSAKTIVNEITARYGAPKNTVKEFVLKLAHRL